MAGKPDKTLPTAAEASQVLDVPRWTPGLEGLDWRDRLFVLLYVSTDGDRDKSYRIAYGKADKDAAFEVLGRPEIMDGVRVLQTRMAAASGWGLDEVLARLQTIADGHMGRFVSLGEDGSAAFDLRALSEADWRAVKGLTIKGKGATQEIRVELHDAAAALATLGRHFGMGLGSVKVVEDEKRERSKVAELLGALSDEDLADLERVGQRLEELGGPVIDGEAVEIEEGAQPEGEEPEP